MKIFEHATLFKLVKILKISFKKIQCKLFRWTNRKLNQHDQVKLSCFIFLECVILFSALFT